MFNYIMKPLYQYKALITNVVDGDTVDAVVDVGFRMTAKLRLRLLGVNTPEMKSIDSSEREMALRAKKFTESILLNKEVIIQTEKSDAFGRYLATIYYSEFSHNFNELIINKGFAVKFKE